MNQSLKFCKEDDSGKWENGELGQSAAYATRVSKDIDEAIDNTLGLVPITTRLQKTLVDELKDLAREQGIGYQPYIRQILTQYVKEHRKQTATV